MNETVKLILSLSLSGSILAAVLFALKPFIRNRLSKSIQYYIWIIVLLRLVLPVSFEESLMNRMFYGEHVSGAISSQNTHRQAEEIKTSSAVLPVLPDVNENVKNGVYNNDTDHNRYLQDLINQYLGYFLKYYLLYIWLFGALLAVAANMTGYFRFRRYIKPANKPATDEQIGVLTSILNSENSVYNVSSSVYVNRVSLARNRFVTAPMLMGIFKPCIIIPDNDFDRNQLKSILLHEVSHLRRFDLAVKWFTMLAASIHWFNPLMYFIKKEMNHACELACDEAVIKNLNAAEKQAYGDTLITVAAEQKYPAGVLQATMSEDKRNLKERLTAIMKYTRKSKSIVILSVVILCSVIYGALYLGAGISFAQGKPPIIYISTEGSQTKAARTGAYEWRHLGSTTHVESVPVEDLKYEAENMVSVQGRQQLAIGTQKIKTDKEYDFTLQQISVFKDGEPIKSESVEPSFMNGLLYVLAPEEKGEYVFSVRLGFKNRGTVSYGFVVRVDILTYDLKEISKYKTQYVGNHSKVGGIISRLPLPDSYFRQRFISLDTNERPYGLTAYYEAASPAPYEAVTGRSSAFDANLRTNALVAFCMIDNVDKITFAFRNSQSEGKLEESKYTEAFTFRRADFEEKYGSLSALGENLDLLQDTLEGKKSAFKGLELYVWRKPILTGNDNLYYTLLLGTNRNKTAEEVYDLNAATSDLKVIKQKLSGYRSGTDLFIMHSMDIDKDTMSMIGDELSGIIKNGVTAIGGHDLDK